MSNNERTLRVQVKTKFGMEMVHPLCETSKIFAKLVGKQTLNAEQLKLIKKLGFDVEFVAQTVET